MERKNDILDSMPKADRPVDNQILQRVLGIVLLLLGIYYLVSVYATYHDLDSAISILTQGNAEPTTFQIFKHLHLVILIPLLEVIAGLLLFFGKRSGWILAVIVVADKLLLALITLWKMSPDHQPTFIVFMSIYAAVYLAILLFLLYKPFRKRYVPTANTWLWISGTILILLADRMTL